MIPALAALLKKLGTKAIASKVASKAATNTVAKKVAGTVAKDTIKDKAATTAISPGLKKINPISPSFKGNVSLSRLADNEMTKLGSRLNPESDVEAVAPNKDSKLKRILNSMPDNSGSDKNSPQPYQRAPLVNNLTPNGIPFQDNIFENETL